MTTLTHVQDEQAFEALTDEELDSVDGGLMQIPLIIVGLIAGSLKGWSTNSRVGIAKENSSDLWSEEFSAVHKLA